MKLINIDAAKSELSKLVERAEAASSVVGKTVAAACIPWGCSLATS
jgi:hypothetical protein